MSGRIVRIVVYAIGGVLALNVSGIVGTTTLSRFRGLYAVFFIALAVATPLVAIAGERSQRPVRVLLAYVGVWIVLLGTFTLLAELTMEPARSTSGP